MIGIGIGIPSIRTLGKGGNAHVYDLRDEFVVGEVAPITSPRTAEPGPGSLTISDVESLISISGGMLVFGDPATPAWGELAVKSANVTRVNGLAGFGAFNLVPSSHIYIGLTSLLATSSPNPPYGIHFTSSGDLINVMTSGENIVTGVLWTALADVYVAIVLRSAGAFFLCRTPVELWKLLYITLVGVDASVGIHVNKFDGGDSNIDFLHLVSLPTNGYTIWADDYGIATDRLAGARSASDTFTHEADCLIEFEVTAIPSSGNIRFLFRMQDSTHFWRILINAAGDLILHEFDGGTVVRATAAGVLSGGERIVIVCDDETIRGYYDNTLAWTYSSAANFITATSGELNTLDTGGAVSDIVSWPRIIGQGVNTDLLVGAVADNTAFTHAKDCRIVFELDTLPASGDTIMQFRKQDANNYWQVSVNSAGDIALHEVLEGVNQPDRISSAAAISGGERITIIANEHHYTLLYDDTLAGTHDSAFTLFNAFMNGMISLSPSGVINDLVSWPLPDDSGDEAYISLEAASA